MKIIKKTYNKIIRFILYRIHLKEFKLLWMHENINKKQFKQYLNMEILLMYDRLDHEFSKYKRMSVKIL